MNSLIVLLLRAFEPDWLAFKELFDAFNDPTFIYFSLKRKRASGD